METAQLPSSLFKRCIVNSFSKSISGVFNLNKTIQKSFFYNTLPLLLAIALFAASLLFSSKTTYRNAQHERQTQVLAISRNIYFDGLSTAWQPITDSVWNVSKLSSIAEASGPTIIRLEFPFHGVFGNLLATFTGWHNWIPILVSAVASILLFISSWLFYRQFLGYRESCISLFILSTSPMVLHFGQVPMPDILSLLGFSLSLYFSSLASYRRTISIPAIGIRNQWLYLVASSLSFGFALLAKASIILFLLPVLFIVAGSFQNRMKVIISLITFLAIAFIPLMLWQLLSVFDPQNSYSLIDMFTIDRNTQAGGLLRTITSAGFVMRTFAYLSFFGVGVIGVILSIAAAISSFSGRSNRVYLVFIASILLSYLAIPNLMQREPQYTLPVIFGLAFLSGEGFACLKFKLQGLKSQGFFYFIAIILLTVQLTVSSLAFKDLKADRVPSAEELARIGKLLGKDEKIIIISASYGPTPTFFLDRMSTILIHKPGMKSYDISEYSKAGFGYILFWDYSLRDGFSQKRRIVSSKAAHPDLYKKVSSKNKLIYSSDHAWLFKIS